MFLFCFSSSCVPYVGSFSGKALIYVICVCLLYTYCVFVLFFFVLCTLCWQFLWEGSYLRYLCLFTINVLCFCFVFLRLVYPMLAVSLGVSYLRYLCLFTIHILCFYFVFLRLVYPMLAVSLGGLLFTLFVFVYYTHIVFLFCFSSSCVPYVGSFSGKALIYVICVCLLYTFVSYVGSFSSRAYLRYLFVYYKRIVFLFCFSSSCVPYVGSFSGKALIYVICVCLLYTYCVFVLFFFVLCTLCWQFLWKGSSLRYLCLFTINVLCFCFVFLRLVYPMLTVSLGRLLFTLFVFVYYTRIMFLFCFSSSMLAVSLGRLLFTYLCLFTIHILWFCFVFLRLVYPMLTVSLGGLLFTLFVFVYYTHIVFLFRFSSSSVPYVGSFSGRALIYVICVCFLCTYCVFVLFFFVLCTLYCQFLWEGSYLRYLCFFTIHVLCFYLVFLRLVYPMLAVSLGGLLFTLFVFVYYKRIMFLFCFSSSCVPYLRYVGMYCVFVLFFFVLCTLYCQFLWEGSYLRYLCLFTIHVLCFCFVFLRQCWQFPWKALIYVICVCLLYTYCVFVLFFFVLCTPMLAVSLLEFPWLLFTLFVFVYYTRIVFLFCFSSSCVPYVGSFPGKALIYVICVCLLYTYCVFILFFFVLCTLCWQFLWEVSYLRYLCLFTIHILYFYLVFLRLVYPMLTISLGGLLFTLFVFVYYTHIVFLFCFSSSCVPYVGSFSGRALIYVICVCLL